MYPSSSRLIRHPFATYAVLSCLFAWIFIIAQLLGGATTEGQFPLGPIIAAAVVAAGLGRAGLQSWWRQLRALRAAPRWYLLALLAPIVILALAVLLNTGFGAPLPTGSQLSGWTGLGGTALVILIAIGIGEEAGWTAFAAPWLLERHGFIRSWLVLGAVRTFWHLPLMIQGELSLTIGIGGNFAFQFLVLWMFRRTGVWFLAAIWHTVLNTVGGSFLFQMVEGADLGRLGVLMIAGYVALAVVVFALDRRRLDQA